MWNPKWMSSSSFSRLPRKVFIYLFIFCSVNHTKKFQGSTAITITNYVSFSPPPSSLLAMQLISYFSIIWPSIICWLNKRRWKFRNREMKCLRFVLTKTYIHSPYVLLKEIIYHDLRQKHFCLCCPFLLI